MTDLLPWCAHAAFFLAIAAGAVATIRREARGESAAATARSLSAR